MLSRGLLTEESSFKFPKVFVRIRTAGTPGEAR